MLELAKAGGAVGPSIRSYLSHFRNVIIIVGVGLVVVFAVLGVYLYGKDQRSAEQQPAQPEQAQEVQQDASAPPEEANAPATEHAESPEQSGQSPPPTETSNQAPPAVANTGPQELSNTGPGSYVALAAAAVGSVYYLYRRSKRQLQIALRT